MLLHFSTLQPDLFFVNHTIAQVHTHTHTKLHQYNGKQWYFLTTAWLVVWHQSIIVKFTGTGFCILHFYPSLLGNLLNLHQRNDRSLWYFFCLLLIGTIIFDHPALWEIFQLPFWCSLFADVYKHFSSLCQLHNSSLFCYAIPHRFVHKMSSISLITSYLWWDIACVSYTSLSLKI